MLDKTLPKPVPDAAVSFLVSLRPRGPWNLCAIRPDAGITSATFSDAGKARAWITAHADHANVYYGINPAAPGRSGRAKKTETSAIEYLFGDFDADKFAEGHDLYPLPLEERKDAIARELSASNAPTFIVDTGGGLQALWRLDESLPTNPENVLWAENSNRWLAHAFAGGDTGVTDIGRLLRLPGTVNFPDERKQKRGRVVAPTRLIHATGELHDRKRFGQMEAAAGNVDAEDFDVSTIEYVTDLDDLVARYGLSDRTRTIILEGRLPDVVKEHDDSRDKWLMDGACQMVRAGVPVGVVAGALLNSAWGISGHVYDHKGRTHEAYAVRQATRAAAMVAAERKAEVDSMGELLADSASSDGISQRHRFHLYSMRELRDAPSPVWLVQGLITEQSLALIYGASKSFKTFTALDMALCIAMGRDFHGKTVRQGVVVYIAAEGHQAETYQRVRAWCIENDIDEDALEGCFHLIITGAKLNSDEDRRELIEHLPLNVDIVFFDTLQRNMVGDESSTADASAVIRGVDEVRRVRQCAAALIHHTGKSGDAERGSSVYRASADSIIKIKKERPHKGVKRSSLTADAMRASPDGWSMGFEIHPVVTDPETLTSTLVLRLVEEGTEVEVATGGMSSKEAAAQRARDAMLLEIWRTAPEKQSALARDGRSAATVTRYVKELREDRLLEPGSLKLTEDGISHAEALDEIEKINL